MGMAGILQIPLEICSNGDRCGDAAGTEIGAAV